MNRNIHIGSIVKKISKEKGISVKEFAKALHCTSGNIYDIFNRNIIDYELLQKISKFLDYDFMSECYSYEKKHNKYSFVLIEIDNSKLIELSSNKSVKILKVFEFEEIIKYISSLKTSQE